MVSALEHLVKAIQGSKTASVVWGRRGEQVVSDIESKLGVQFSTSLRGFIREFGNVTLSPFEIVVAGDNEGRSSCLTKTLRLRRRDASVPDNYVQIMDYAGVIYCVVTGESGTGKVVSWDKHHPFAVEGILDEFPSFDSFVEWLIDQSIRIASDTQFQF